MLFNAMFRAMNAPMQAMPCHCFCSVARCISQGCISAIGASTTKLKAMWPATQTSQG